MRRFVMRRTEQTVLSITITRDHVLQADVGSRVVHDRAHPSPAARRLLALHSNRRAVFPQDLEGIECRLDRRTYRPFLDILREIS